MGHHIAHQRAHPGQLFLVRARHFIDEGALAVDHLVVRNGKDIIFGKSVKERKRDIVVIVFAVDGVERHVMEHVVHPAHIPFVIEAQPPAVSGARNHGPRGRLLRDHHHLRRNREHRLVELLQERDGLQVLPAAVLVRDPFAFLAAVIQVEHGGHGVRADSVDVVFFQPENRAGNQEADDLVPAVIENERPPLLMLPLARVGVFIAGRPVEPGKPAFILRKMSRDPIHNHADPGLMALFHKAHEILRGAVARGGGEIPRHLIPPRAVVGIFGHRHQLHMGVAHLLHIGDQLVRKLFV